MIFTFEIVDQRPYLAEIEAETAQQAVEIMEKAREQEAGADSHMISIKLTDSTEG